MLKSLIIVHMCLGLCVPLVCVYMCVFKDIDTLFLCGLIHPACLLVLLLYLQLDAIYLKGFPLNFLVVLLSF